MENLGSGDSRALGKTAARLPKGLAFEIADHARASKWAKLNQIPFVIELDYRLGIEDYEEVLALYVAIGSERVRYVIWRDIDCVVVQAAAGLANKFPSVNEALNFIDERRQ